MSILDRSDHRHSQSCSHQSADGFRGSRFVEELTLHSGRIANTIQLHAKFRVAAIGNKGLPLKTLGRNECLLRQSMRPWKNTDAEPIFEL